MNKSIIAALIPKEGRQRICEAKKRLDQLLEITQCAHCKKSKPLSEFGEDKSGHLGFSKFCQACSDYLNDPQNNYKCSKCGKTKGIENFYRIKNVIHHEWCIECVKHFVNKRASNGFTRKCSVCGEVKLASTENFYITIGCKDFLKPACRTCERIREKKLREKNKKMINK